jgi:hypothetical protein
MGRIALAGTIGMFAVAGAATVASMSTGSLGAAVAQGSLAMGSGEADVAAEQSSRGFLFRRPSHSFYAPSDAMIAHAQSVLANPESFSRGPASLFAPADALAPQDRECEGRSPDRFYEFSFTRAIYSTDSRDRSGRNRGFGGRNSGRGPWSTDYPKADCQFISVVKRLAGLDIFYDSNAINLDDSRVRNFPFLYALEVGEDGGWSLSDAETLGLQDYLAAGGFLVIDDFWGTQEWRNFEREMTRILPEHPIVELPLDHEVFRIFYDIEEIIQVPNVGNGRSYAYGCMQCTSENDGYIPRVFGIHDEKGRLMVIINFNTDLGDAWEWAEVPDYPIKFSTHAFEMGVNMILYSMTH